MVKYGHDKLLRKYLLGRHKNHNFTPFSVTTSHISLNRICWEFIRAPQKLWQKQQNCKNLEEAFQIAVKPQFVFFNLIRMWQYLLRHGLGRFYVGFEKQCLTIIASVSSRHSAKKNRAKLTVSAVHAKSKRNSVAISILRVECEFNKYYLVFSSTFTSTLLSFSTRPHSLGNGCRSQPRTHVIIISECVATYEEIGSHSVMAWSWSWSWWMLPCPQRVHQRQWWFHWQSHVTPA